MELIKKRISELVKDNPTYAKALHFLGIYFDNYAEKTLEEVCAERNLNPELLRKNLEEAGAANSNQTELTFTDYPVDLVVQYLRHAHHLFIKTRLPYLSRLVESLDPAGFDNPQTADDLKFVFPLFCRDYIVHLYEEEDTLFTYIEQLLAAKHRPANPADLYFLMEKNSIARFAAGHAAHDDTMHGIRELTGGFTIGANAGLTAEVVMSELRLFEQELTIHANIEDNILFPKALLLENEVKERAASQSGSN